MAYIKKTIRDLIKQSATKQKAREKAEDWFNKAVKSKDDKGVELTPKPFKPGKIYAFQYNHPLLEKELDWFDKRPVVLALYPINKTTDCGINLNLLPIKFKEELLDKFYEAFSPTIHFNTTGSKKENAINQQQLIFKYENIKKFLDKFGFGFAIRQYKVNLKKNQAVVSYENWPQIALCDFIKISGSTVWHVRRMFTEYNINRLKF